VYYLFGLMIFCFGKGIVSAGDPTGIHLVRIGVICVIITGVRNLYTLISRSLKNRRERSD
jgi:hypothetical protein